MKKEYITKENKEALEKEYQELTQVKRAEIIAAIEYAKSLGDLSENAEYHSAREAQARLVERISTIEHILNNAVVVEPSATGAIGVGSSVTIKKVGDTNTRNYMIVGSEESDMLAGKISYKSPLGSALFEKKKGDVVSVEAPKGVIEYEIISVE